MSINPSGLAALLNGTSGNITAPTTGGVVAVTAALVGSLVLTSTSGAALATVPATSVGVFPVASSSGACLSWALSSAADVGKCYLALLSNTNL